MADKALIQQYVKDSVNNSDMNAYLKSLNGGRVLCGGIRKNIRF
jgi:hypothetical protein